MRLEKSQFNEVNEYRINLTFEQYNQQSTKKFKNLYH